MLDLKRNLISVGIIDQMEYNIRIEFSEIMIVKGTKTIMKGIKEKWCICLRWRNSYW